MKLKTRVASILMASALMVGGLAGCGSGGNSGGSSNGNLTMQIWDKSQEDAMQALADKYHEENPDVTIEIQVTSWDEYWTKLEASAKSKTMPDIFWMHTNQILTYADAGMLADCSDLYDASKFSDISLSNTQGSDGVSYGIPKDKDSVGLVYNKEMFDQAGVAYPDENWTWDDIEEASKKIHDATGKYGYMAYCDDQLGYWNAVYQAGGYILNDDKTASGFQNEGTIKAMNWYIGLQKNDWCPDQTYFAETAPGDAFFSGQGAMFLEGSWNLFAEMTNYPDMQGKWDVAVLPKCPDPVDGDGRATISNGLCYSTAAYNQDNETIMNFLQWLGTEEAQKIHASYGAAISAYNGEDIENEWINAFDQFDYKLNVQAFIDMMDYSVQSVNDKSRPNWKSQVNDELLKIYGGQNSIDDGLKTIDNIINTAIKEAAE
ncbi:MAG: sugar ABC transporter substrate-binding protein [Clostridiales bacterium]|nr:sugar ABC transporter substrate-binding protein [Clostridiales bacterium]